MRIIDADKQLIGLKKMKVVDDADKQSIRFAILILENAPSVEAIPKADYENRLKDDLVAILEDLDLQIDEMDIPQFNLDGMNGFYWCQGYFKDLIREKINALKGETR